MCTASAHDGGLERYSTGFHTEGRRVVEAQGEKTFLFYLSSVSLRSTASPLRGEALEANLLNRRNSPRW